jgi:hypothetical protein
MREILSVGFYVVVLFIVPGVFFVWGLATVWLGKMEDPTSRKTLTGLLARSCGLLLMVPFPVSLLLNVLYLADPRPFVAAHFRLTDAVVACIGIAVMFQAGMFWLFGKSPAATDGSPGETKSPVLPAEGSVGAEPKDVAADQANNNVSRSRKGLIE